jgi:hypothetical protein
VRLERVRLGVHWSFVDAEAEVHSVSTLPT